jgi:nickel-dependent lactate racemase
MKIHLAYGKNGLDVNLDDAWNVQVVEPQYLPGLPEPLQALREALQKPAGTAPLADLAGPGDRVGIIVNDITRATPNPVILRALLDQLQHIPDDRITLFIALGTHRQVSGEELTRLVGAEFTRRLRVVQNDCFDPATQVNLGLTRQGHPAWINRELAQCDLKILTGFIEPHFFAGFSGGGKAVMPGMAGLATIMANHCAANIAHPQATWGVTRGNPIWEEVMEVAHKVAPTFLLNVTLNRDKQITGVFAGDLDTAHALGVEFARKTAMAPVEQPFDIVVTSNSGYPLDINLYQSVKGMSSAAQVVRPGGAIVIATECWDGIPSHGLYGELLRNSANPQELLDTILQPGFSRQDQWEAQVQAQIQLKADVYVYTDHLSPEQIRLALLNPAASVESAMEELVERYGKNARICVLPEGPLTIPYIVY